MFRSAFRRTNAFRFGAASSKRHATYYYFDGPKGKKSYSMVSPRSKNFLLGSGLLVGFIIYTHIEEAPVTHRKRVLLCPEWLEDDVSQLSYSSVMSEFGSWVLPDYHPTTVQVRRVMKRLITSAEGYHDPETGETKNLFTELGGKDIPLEDWKINVIDDIAMHRESPNAFVIGGGKVFVFRSILPLCKNDNGLATVLAHELGHQLAHHIGEKLTKSPLNLATIMLSYSLFGSPNVGGIAQSLLVEMPSSRAMETEADYIGLMLMAHACYNPHDAPEFWSRMIQMENKTGGSIPELLSTHPSSERRNLNMKEWLPEAEKEFELAGCGNFAEKFGSFPVIG